MNHIFSLNDKYVKEEGSIVLSGVQALVRLPIDQHRADQKANLNTAVFISGYRGSPIGGLDILLQDNKNLLERYNTIFMPGVNEDLAATAVFGSQLANLLPTAKYDGVLGMWYGKSPGLDRSGDAFKHANFCGVGRHGGVLAVVGDDPIAKSSTLPSHSEIALFDAQMPILYPGTVQEVIELGRYGFELSRYSGSWVGLKLVTDVADSFAVANVFPIENIVRPAISIDDRHWRHSQNPTLIAPYSIQQEQELCEKRLEAANLFAVGNKFNRVTVSSVDDWLGIVAAGKTYYDVCEALEHLGFDNNLLNKCGLRLLKMGMIYPVEPEIIRSFARGLKEILVIEEKRSFLELFIREILYNQNDHPIIVGKRDEYENLLVKSHGELDVDQVVNILIKRLQNRVTKELSLKYSSIADAALSYVAEPLEIELTRSPYFCSGCPHNRSTIVPKDSIVGAGIGCHGMALTMDRNTVGITHMGGEGVQWVGALPFTNLSHIFQNLGDGTLFHSGSLAIRQAISANTNITYKILYNSTVAMTGGQVIDGAMDIPELVSSLRAEGVRKIIICTGDVEKYYSAIELNRDVEVFERKHLNKAHDILRKIPGVTVLIYDQPCADDLRRKRRRGVAIEPDTYIFINEAVCEGCGDCGEKSNCLSVYPVETEYGRKTQIHQSSCNKDYTCLDGNCPAFISVTPCRDGKLDITTKSRTFVVDRDLPVPKSDLPKEASIVLVGIGGSGIVTITQMLGVAAFLEGKWITSLNQTGLSQKGGLVTAHIKITETQGHVSSKVGTGQADVYIVCDILTGSAPKNLSYSQPKKTTAIVSTSQIPTGTMVKSTTNKFPKIERLKKLINLATKQKDNIYFDFVSIAENLFGDHLPANMIMIGVAYQLGLLPVSKEAIEKAIELNEVAVMTNKSAFNVGRLLIVDPSWEHSLHRLDTELQKVTAYLTPDAEALVNSVAEEGELRRLLIARVLELIAYQDIKYAQEYVDFVRRVKNAEPKGFTQLSESVARYLFKLMAYKDEYEVARLHLRSESLVAVENKFGKDVQITYHLNPPILKMFGLNEKIKFGRWFTIVFYLLTKLKVIRGTPLDIFGYSKMRTSERQLIIEYRQVIEQALVNLSQDTYDRAVQIACLPDIIRGYEEVKLKNIKNFQSEVARLRY